MRKLLHLILKAYVSSDWKHRFLPIQSGTEMGPEAFLEIEAFRRKVYQGAQSYLIPASEAEQAAERLIDSRSQHALARDRQTGELVGLARMTPQPYEVKVRGIALNADWSLEGAYEISRLMTSRPGSRIGTRLLIHLGYWAVYSGMISGFVAICRQHRFDFFKKFGLHELARAQVPNRPHQDYVLIAGNFDEIHHSTMRYFRSLIQFRSGKRHLAPSVRYEGAVSAGSARKRVRSLSSRKAGRERLPLPSESSLQNEAIG